MSFEKRRTATVVGVIEGIVAAGKQAFRPGDVSSALREKGMPMGAWEIRAEFTNLEQLGYLRCDSASGDWLINDQDAMKSAG